MLVIGANGYNASYIVDQALALSFLACGAIYPETMAGRMLQENTRQW